MGRNDSNYHVECNSDLSKNSHMQSISTQCRGFSKRFQSLLPLLSSMMAVVQVAFQEVYNHVFYRER
jgi:hypothetical protein